VFPRQRADALAMGVHFEISGMSRGSGRFTLGDRFQGILGCLGRHQICASRCGDEALPLCYFGRAALTAELSVQFKRPVLTAHPSRVLPGCATNSAPL
jgi:hypothetical protein